MIQSWFTDDLMAAFKGFLLERLELARFFFSVFLFPIMR